MFFFQTSLVCLHKKKNENECLLLIWYKMSLILYKTTRFYFAVGQYYEKAVWNKAVIVHINSLLAYVYRTLLYKSSFCFAIGDHTLCLNS